MKSAGYNSLSEAEKSALWKKFRAGDEKGRRDLIEYNYPLVHAIVSRFDFLPQRREDLFQAGVVGLIAALERFDPDRGVAFGTYAFPYIKGEVVQAVAECKGESKAVHLRRLKKLAAEDPLKNALGNDVSLEGLAEASESLAFADDRAEALMMQLENSLNLRQTVSRLGAEEKQLLYYRYGLGKSQAETGALLSLSQGRICRKEKVILAKLREML